MYLHWSWSHKDLAGAQNDKVAQLATEIIRSSRKGYHLVSISRLTAEWLLDNVALSAFDHAHLRSLSSSYTQTGGLRHTAPVYMDVANIGHDFEVDGTRIKISLNYALKSNVLEPAKLIVENIDNDGWLFDLITRQMSKSSRIGVLSFEISHGGGRDVVRVLTQQVAAHRIAVLITDSDKKFPTAKNSKTASTAEKICKQSNSPFCIVKTLPCHEIENLLPLDVVRQLQSAHNHSGVPHLDAISISESALSCAPHDRYWLHFDIKNGVSEASLAKFEADGIRWHSDKLALVGLIFGQRNIDGFGDRILPQLQSSGATIASFINHMKKSEWRDVFQETFMHACWIFAGDRPLIT